MNSKAMYKHLKSLVHGVPGGRRLWGFMRELDSVVGKNRQAVKYLKVLDSLEEPLPGGETLVEAARGIRILYGPAFSISGPSFTHDRVISRALKLRGAEIIPMYCDGLQSVECNVFGGVWMKGDFESNCKDCIQKSQSLWLHHDKTALRLSDYVDETERQKVREFVSGLGVDEWPSYVDDDLPIGHWARNILINNETVADYRLVPNHQERGLAHVRNLLLLKIAYEKILDMQAPDRVVSNDSYYGMWALLEALCKRRGIPFYSHWPVTKTRSAFACNGAAMDLDFSVAWPSFSKKKLSHKQKTRVKNWLDAASGSKGLIIDTASVGKHQNVDFDLGKIDPNKPVAIMPTNVIWDLAALDKQVVFDDMIDWIAQTIEWFRERPQYQLIIKPHPAEQYPQIPETIERVEVALAKLNIDMPGNVFLLSPKVNLTAYDFFPIASIGLVHTTSVGMEMAAAGMPVVTSGKSPYRGYGFTYDPANKEQYFAMLEELLSHNKCKLSDEMIELTYKFITFYQFHYYVDLGIATYDLKKPPELKIGRIEDIEPGKKPHLDYIVDSIIGGLPIVSKNRWPEES